MLLGGEQVEGGEVFQIVGKRMGCVGDDGEPGGGEFAWRGALGADGEDGEAGLGDELVEERVVAQAKEKGAALLAVGVVEEEQRQAVGSGGVQATGGAVGCGVGEVGGDGAWLVARELLQAEGGTAACGSVGRRCEVLQNEQIERVVAQWGVLLVEIAVGEVGEVRQAHGVLAWLREPAGYGRLPAFG